MFSKPRNCEITNLHTQNKEYRNYDLVRCPTPEQPALKVSYFLLLIYFTAILQTFTLKLLVKIYQHQSSTDFGLNTKICLCTTFSGIPDTLQGAEHKGPVKLMQQVKIAHSFLQFVSDQFHIIILSLLMWFYKWLSKFFKNLLLKMEKHAAFIGVYL